MAEVNLKLADNVYTPQPGCMALADTPQQLILATGANEAAFIPALFATCGDSVANTYNISVWIEKSSTIISYICEARPIKSAGKEGNHKNILEGSQIMLGEESSLYVYLYSLIGPGGGGDGCRVNVPSWTLITPA